MNPETELDVAVAPKRNSRHWKQKTVTWGEVCEWLDDPAAVKESGNYLLGELVETTVVHDPKLAPDKKCTNLHRNKQAVVSRCAIALDADYAKRGMIDRLEMLLPYAVAIHSTFNSTPEEPRYRILLPLDRKVDPEEYHAIASVLMDRIGREEFDPGSNQPERYMFKPSAIERDNYEHRVIDGDPVPADELLEEYDYDLEGKKAPKVHPNKRDPFSLEGVVGAFNRAYDFDEVIEEYELPYESTGPGRWHLVGARSQGGVGIVADGLIFSHHIKDPAAGVTCSAFDLVRLHRFGDLDSEVAEGTPVNRRPSHEAMLKLAAGDKRVAADLVGADFASLGDGDDEDGPSDWRLGLKINPRTGKIEDSIANLDLIRNNDVAFSTIHYNELTFAIEVDDDLPWRPVSRGGPTFAKADRSALAHHLEREYKLRLPRGIIDELVEVRAQERFSNPVRDYLEGLPKWDGRERVETCLPGVTEHTDYTRMVARKCFVAAVARVFEPGIKWDHTPVLAGPEGLGKSWWIDRVFKGYSATLGRLGDKDTLLTLHRSWVVIADEGHSLKKADQDVLKEFLTRTHDVFRLPYDREATAHPRKCVTWSTTNDDVFLRRQEGNRRYLIVKAEAEVDFSVLTDAYVDQLWAEALELYRAGERLYLVGDEKSVAADEREDFTEEDALGGVIEAYLETLVPEEWDSMSPDARRLWLVNSADGFEKPGTRLQTEVCSAQIWVEALGRRFGDHKRADLLDINAALKRIPGWKVAKGRRRLPNYGSQLVYVRDRDEDLL